MKELKLSTKGAELVKFYEIMATEGFQEQMVQRSLLSLHTTASN